MEDRALFEADNGLFWMAAILALANADHPDTPALWEETLATRTGTARFLAAVDEPVGRRVQARQQGELAEAEESLRTNLVEAELYGLKVPQAAAYYVRASSAACCWRWATSTAPREAIAQGPPRRRATARDGTNFVRRRGRASTWPRATASARWRLPRTIERHATSPVTRRWVPWRSLKAQALALLGRREEAIDLASEVVELAREWGAPTGSDVAPGARRAATREGLDELEEAAALLEGSSQRIERARAFAALGAELRRARRPTEPGNRCAARSSWRRRGARAPGRERSLRALRHRSPAALDRPGRC